MRLKLALILLSLAAAPALRAEYVVLRSGQRLHITSYERRGDKVELRVEGGLVEVDLTEGKPRMLEWPVVICQARQAVDPSLVQKSRSMEYLGHNRWGVVYARDGYSFDMFERRDAVALGMLPRIRSRLIRALEIVTDRTP